MQTDARLIQNICHSDQAGTDLCRQTDTLCFSAGERSGCACQCQIIQSDIDKKSYACLDLLDHLFPDQKLLPGKLHII